MSAVGARLAQGPWFGSRARRIALVRERPLELVLMLGAAAYILAFAGTGVLRAIYPYPVDGIEPGAMQEVQRVAQGQPIYAAPELGYVPLIYTPLHFYLAALPAILSGSALLGLRLVSLLASLGAIGLVALLVRRETRSWSLAALGAGLLAAANPLVGLAMDAGRMDALALFFLLAGTYSARGVVLDRASGWPVAAATGVAFGLAVWAKQSSAPVSLVGVGLCGLLRPRLALPCVLGLLATLGLGGLILWLQSGSWAVFYIWELPRRHDLRSELVMRFWPDILARFTLPTVVGPLFLFARLVERDFRRLALYGGLVGAMIAVAWAGHATIGGGRNVQLPAFAALALLFPLGLHQALLRSGMRAFFVWLGLAELIVLLYNPRLVVPYSSDRWDGERLSASLARLPGPIFAGSYGGYLKGVSAYAPDLGAVAELEGAFGGDSTPAATQWEGQLSSALQTGQLTYVIVDPDIPTFVVPNLARSRGYQYLGPLFPEDDVYWAWRTGWAPKADVYARSDLAQR